MIGSVLTEAGGRLCLSDRVGPFVDEVAAAFDEVVFCGPRAGPDDPTFHPGGRPLFDYAVRAPNVRVVATPWVPLEAPLRRRLAGLAGRVRPHARLIRDADLVFLWMPSFSGVAAHALCRRRRRPYAVYVSGDWQEIAPYTGPWRGAAGALLAPYRWLSARAERAVVRHARFAIVDGQRLVAKFAGLGVPVEEAVPRTPVGAAEGHGRADTCQGPRVRLLHVGALVRRKGVEDVIEALALLAARGRPVDLQVVGAGEPGYEAALRAAVDRHGLAGRVEFAGHVADLGRLLACYRAADVFVLATRGEGFPRVLLEAMSQGLPVVTTAIGTIRAMLTDGREARLVPPARPAALADAVDELIRDGGLRRALLRHGAAFARSRLAGERPSAQLLRLLRAHAGLAAPGPPA
jgi:glycosyltransferase involved in cell wall biosynthesis